MKQLRTVSHGYFLGLCRVLMEWGSYYRLLCRDSSEEERLRAFASEKPLVTELQDFERGMVEASEFLIESEQTAINIRQILFGQWPWRPTYPKSSKFLTLLKEIVLLAYRRQWVLCAYADRYKQELAQTVGRLFNGYRKEAILAALAGNRSLAVEILASEFVRTSVHHHLDNKWLRFRRLGWNKEQRRVLYLEFLLESLSSKEIARIASRKKLRVEEEGLLSNSEERKESYWQSLLQGQFAKADALFIYAFLVDSGEGVLKHSDVDKIAQTRSLPAIDTRSRNEFEKCGLAQFIFNQLSSKSEEHRLAVAEEFRRLSKVGFLQALDSILDAGPMSDLIRSWFSESSEVKTAAMVQAALFQLEGYSLARLFLEREKNERERLIESYQNVYQPRRFWLELRRSCSQRECEIIRQLYRRGHLSLGSVFYICTTGLGTDEQTIQRLIQVLSPAEVQRSEVEFRRYWRVHSPRYERMFPRWFGNLERRLWLETGGDTWFDFQTCIRRIRSRQISMFAEVRAIYTHEVSGSVLQAVSRILPQSAVLSRHLDWSASSMVPNRLSEYSASSLNVETEIERRVLDESRAKLLQLDVDVYRKFKHFLGNTLTNMVAGTSACLSAIALSFTLLPLSEVMLNVAFVSIFCRLLLKRAIKGRGYDREEICGDIFFGCIDGVTLYASRILRRMLLRGGSAITKFGFKRGVRKFSRSLNNVRIARLGVDVLELVYGYRRGVIAQSCTQGLLSSVKQIRQAIQHTSNASSDGS